MSIIKATKEKVSKDISFIFYENNKIPRYRKIDKFSFSFLTYGPAFLTLISIIIASSSLYYAGTIERQIRSTEPEIIRELRSQNISLTSRVDELNIINEKLTEKLSSSVPEESGSGNLFAPVPGQKDLTSPVTIEVQDFKAQRVDKTLKVTYNVINLTKENKKINDENNLKLFFDGTIQNDDEIQLAFKDIEGENHLSKKIKGSDSRWQRISFSFPEESIPYSFRLSLNNNESNKIKFDKIVLNRKNDRIIIRDSALLVYFELKNLKHEFEGKKLILEKISANQKAELVSKDNLNSRIENRYSKINP